MCQPVAHSLRAIRTPNEPAQAKATPTALPFPSAQPETGARSKVASALASVPPWSSWRPAKSEPMGWHWLFWQAWPSGHSGRSASQSRVSWEMLGLKQAVRNNGEIQARPEIIKLRTPELYGVRNFINQTLLD